MHSQFTDSFPPNQIDGPWLYKINQYKKDIFNNLLLLCAAGIKQAALKGSPGPLQKNTSICDLKSSVTHYLRATGLLAWNTSTYSY